MRESKIIPEIVEIAIIFTKPTPGEPKILVESSAMNPIKGNITIARM